MVMLKLNNNNLINVKQDMSNIYNNKINDNKYFQDKNIIQKNEINEYIINIEIYEDIKLNNIYKNVWIYGYW